MVKSLYYVYSKIEGDRSCKAIDGDFYHSELDCFFFSHVPINGKLLQLMGPLRSLRVLLLSFSTQFEPQLLTNTQRKTTTTKKLTSYLLHRADCNPFKNMGNSSGKWHLQKCKAEQIETSSSLGAKQLKNSSRIEQSEEFTTADTQMASV